MKIYPRNLRMHAATHVLVCHDCCTTMLTGRPGLTDLGSQGKCAAMSRPAGGTGGTERREAGNAAGMWPAGDGDLSG